MYYNEIESIVFGSYGTSDVVKIDSDAKYLKLRYYDTEHEVKLFADLYHVQKTNDDFCEIVKTSDFLLISTYDKESKQTTNMELLEAFPKCSRYFFSGTEQEKDLEKYNKIMSDNFYTQTNNIFFWGDNLVYKPSYDNLEKGSQYIQIVIGKSAPTQIILTYTKKDLQLISCQQGDNYYKFQ